MTPRISGTNASFQYISFRGSAKHKCDIVSIDWLLASIKQKEPLNTRGFLIRALGSTRLVPTTSNATSSPTSTRKRKPSSDSNDGEGRRAKIAKDRVLANRDKLSPLVDKASHAKDGKCLVLAEDISSFQIVFVDLALTREEKTSSLV